MARYTRHNNAKKIRADKEALRRARNDIARVIAQTIYNFFLDSFQRQGWLDNNLQAWPERTRISKRNSGRSLLIDTGALKGSLDIARQNWPTIKVVSAGVAYARAHNEGMTITVPVTDQMRKYFWAKFMETGFPEYKWMATTTQNHFEIDLPQRKFFGHSQTMFKKINHEVRRIINRAFRKT